MPLSHYGEAKALGLMAFSHCHIPVLSTQRTMISMTIRRHQHVRLVGLITRSHLVTRIKIQSHKDLGSNLGSTTYWLYNLGQISSLYAIVLP